MLNVMLSKVNISVNDFELIKNVNLSENVIDLKNKEIGPYHWCLSIG